METIGEYDPATPLSKTYCSRISLQEYEVQGSVETYAALQGLLEYLDTNSEVFKKLLAKKKQEAAENESIFSFLKCKVLEKLKGPDFMMEGISQDECDQGLEKMQNDMCQLFNYAQETKSSPVAKRFSKRLAAKRLSRGSPQRGRTPKKARGPPPPPPPPPYPPPGSGPRLDSSNKNDDRSVLGAVPSPRKPLRHGAIPGKATADTKFGTESATAPPQPPPPPPLSGGPSKKAIKNQQVGKNSTPVAPHPPPPPPPLPGSAPSVAAKRPLQERTNIINTPTGIPPSPAKKKPALKCEERLTQLKKVGSTTSLNSIHDELVGFDRTKLKPAKKRSPGRTPYRKVPSRGPSGRVTAGNINVDSFNLKILEKFKNVHSPSQYGSPGSPNSSFNSTSGFTP